MKGVAAALLLMGGLLVAGGANAFTITINQIGSNVVATASGSYDVTGLTNNSTEAHNGELNAFAGSTIVFVGTGTTDSFRGISLLCTGSIGSPLNNAAASNTGLPVGFHAQGGLPQTIFVPTGTTSGTASASSTWAGATLESLGLASGSITCTWTNGSLTVTVNPAPTSTAQAVPSLSEWTQLMLGLMVMMLIGWHLYRERSY